MKMPEPDPGIGQVGRDLKPRLAESFVEAGKDVAVVAFGADFVFPALNQDVSLEQVVDASNYHHGLRSISSSSQSNTTSTGIKVSVIQQMIPARAAIRYGVMALPSSSLSGHFPDKSQPHPLRASDPAICDRSPGGT
jgi:hypothetical protein